MPEGIRGAWPLGLGLLALLAVVGAVVAWAVWGGEAGTQRGMVIRNEIPERVTIALEDGRTATLDKDRQQTFVVRRDEFPLTVQALDAAGAVITERELEYDFVADADFRISVDRRGFYATELLREPAPPE